MYYTNDYKLQPPTLTSGAHFALFNLFSEKQIIYLMKRFNYSNENFAIMAGDEEWIKKHNPDFFKYEKRSEIRKDVRTLLQYAQDLVANWIFEDSVEKIIQANSSCHIYKNGADKYRKILVSRVTYETDFILKKNEIIKPVELTMDYFGYFYRKEFFHLRLNKFDYLKDEKALLLIIDTQNNLCGLIDFSKPIKHKIVEVQAWGNKEAQEIYLSRDNLHPLSELCLLLENSIQ